MSITEKKNIFYRNRFILLAFFGAALTMLVVFAITGVYPFGKNTVLRMDLYHQYGPLFAELVDRIKSGEGLSYSWVSGLGSCFLGNYFNYLSSPIGAIIVFFGHKHMTEAIAAMILIKAALSAATFTFYLKKSQHNHSAVTASFGILYAFCAYMLAYYWNVMWLDAMVLLPIVLLGIERIIDNGNIWTYFIGLALTFFSNYYMSYMLCLFAVIYFFYYYIISYSSSEKLNRRYKKKGLINKARNSRFFRSGVLFAFASIFAAGLLAFALLPTYNVLKSCSAVTGSFPDELKTYFKFFDFLANHFASLTTTIRSSGDDVLPNVYCGVLTILLAPLYFFTKSISKKEKLATLGLLGFLYLSFNVNYLNFIWHGMHFPNDLPYRFSFIYSFVLLVMAYKTFVRLNEFTSRQIGVSGAALIALIFIAEKVTSKNVGSASVYLTLIFAVFYVLMLTIFKDKKYEIASLAVLLCVCTCSEALIANTASFPNNINRDSYVSDYDDFQTVKNELDTIEQNKFYRMELTDLRTRMDPSWYGYNGVSVFSSMAYEKVARLENRYGLMSNTINSYTYNPQTPVYNMMHALKYIVNNETPNILTEKYYTPVTTTGKYEAYSNNYYLPIAFCVDQNINDWDYGGDEKNSDVNPFDIQGDFFDKATGVGNPFISVPISYITYNNVEPFSESMAMNSFYFKKTDSESDASAVFNITAEHEGNVYIYFKIDGASEKNITVNSKLGTISHSASQDCILDLGRYAADDSISLTIPFEQESGNVTLYVYTIDDEILDKGYSKLSDEAIAIEKFEDTLIEGTITAKTDRVIYTSIPYDKGWNVYIDGQKVQDDDILQMGNAFLGINVKKGNHEIRLEYKVSGLKAGIIISIFSAVVILLYLAFSILNKRKVRGLHRPAFAGMDNYYSEYVIRENPKPEPKQIVSVTPESYSEPVIDGLPKREVFAPPKVKREIFVPSKITVIDVSEESENEIEQTESD